MTDLLRDKVAVVTGTGGMSRAFAEALDAEGATVVVADVDEEGARAVAGDLARGEHAACDVRDDAQVEALVDRAVQRHGAIDVMVAGARIAGLGPITEMSLREWRRVMSVNLDGAFSSVRHAGRAMAATGGGSIVTISAITGLAGTPLIGHVAAANAGVISLTRTAAVELRAQGVRVNAICPGWIGTDPVLDGRREIQEALGVDLDAAIDQAQGRLGTPEDIAPLAVFLASDRSRFSTGSVFVADGGMTASLV